jgi:hypothetical protein
VLPPVVSCFFGRIAPSDAATESCFSIRGNRENELQASRASDTETLQSQVNKAAKKRLSLSGLEILHGRRTSVRNMFARGLEQSPEQSAVTNRANPEQDSEREDSDQDWVSHWQP